VKRPVIDRNTVNIFKLEHRVNEKGVTFEEAQPERSAPAREQEARRNRVILRNELLKRCYLIPPDLFQVAMARSRPPCASTPNRSVNASPRHAPGPGAIPPASRSSR